MAKWLTIVELESFINAASPLLTDEERGELISFLANSPEWGDLMPGTSGLRKIRWGSKRKGKRAGVRIIYYFYSETVPLFLITAYAKNVQEKLTSQQEKRLTKLARELKVECKN